MKKKQTLHVINATHWDREWLLSFVSYRRHLLHHNDQLIELMEQDPAYGHYMMDGQSICVEDYLRLRPDMATRVRKLVRAKRILVGPWYTLPDMPLLSGEAITRNLLVGIATSESVGGAMREGYTACSNGQITQLPQIYNGFDIKSAVLYKGLSDQRAPREFRWQSPDGSEVLTLHLGARYGRTNFYCMVYQPVIANVIHDTPDQNWEYEFKENSMPFRVDGQRYHSPYDYNAMNAPEGWHPQHLGPYLEKLRNQTSEGAATSHLVGFNCMDHTMPFPVTPKLIAAANKEFSDLTVKDSTLPEVFKQIRREAGDDLSIHVGELRDSKVTAKDRMLWWATLSGRMDLKMLNRTTEHMLIDMAEPACTWAWLTGAPYPSASLGEAWKLLLASQAHDSIDGCSLSKVADDIVARFTDVQAMSEGVVEDACHSLLKSALLLKPGVALPEAQIIVFNFDVRPRGGFCQMEIDLPTEMASQDFHLLAEDGSSIVPDVAQLHEDGSGVNGLVGRPMRTQRYRLQFDSPVVAPWSRLSLKIVARKGSRRAAQKGLARGKHVLENEFLKAVVRDDGRVDLTHKETGAIYKGLHYFEDIGDVGEPWNFRPAGKTVVSSGATEIELLENTAWRSVVQVKTSLSLLAARCDQPEGTKNKRAKVHLSSRLILTRSSRWLEVETTIDNNCRDHRLRVCFPTGIKTDKTYAGGQYSVDERATRLPDMSEWIEPIDGYPNYGFAGLSNDKRGLAVLNMGLPEYFVTGEKHDVLSLTLLRAIGLKRWPVGYGVKEMEGSQSLGQMTVRYALYPHSGGWQEGKLLQTYREFASPLLCSELIGSVRKGEKSMLALDAENLEISCVKKAERDDALIVRLWNTTDTKQKGKLNIGIPFESVSTVNLNENPLPEAGATLRTTRRVVRLTVDPGKIVTLRFQFASKDINKKGNSK
ncbi:MAG: hypothetical protein HRT89_06300 [Lentisphaeria bacterium]|nr:hypothetical protein [Lentisphaeria bacterium]